MGEYSCNIKKLLHVYYNKYYKILQKYYNNIIRNRYMDVARYPIRRALRPTFIYARICIRVPDYR